jgi:hypothetical protein
MIMSARYLLDSKEVTQVADHWVGRPVNENEAVYALFHGNSAMPDRWYVYGLSHDAIWCRPENLPEAVRLAHMLLT